MDKTLIKKIQILYNTYCTWTDFELIKFKNNKENCEQTKICGKLVDSTVTSDIKKENNNNSDFLDRQG